MLHSSDFIRLSAKSVSLHPSIEGGMMNAPTPFFCYFFHFLIAEGIAAVPAHAADDDCWQKVALT